MQVLLHGEGGRAVYMSKESMQLHKWKTYAVVRLIGNMHPCYIQHILQYVTNEKPEPAIYIIIASHYWASQVFRCHLHLCTMGVETQLEPLADVEKVYTCHNHTYIYTSYGI